MPKRNPRESAIVYAETRLEPWGRWSRDNPNSLGFPRLSSVYKILRRKLVRAATKNKSKLTVKGKETLSFRPQVVGTMPEAIEEVDIAVARLPEHLRNLLKIEYIQMCGAHINDRCVATGLGRRRYGQLLECAKYSVFVALNT